MLRFLMPASSIGLLFYPHSGDCPRPAARYAGPVRLGEQGPELGAFVRHQTWAGLSAGVSELARRERLLL